MDISIESIGPCTKKVSINISAERVKEELEKNYQQTAKAVDFPGFRKGKAPRKLVIKRFGEIIIEDVKEKLIQEAFTDAIKEHNLEPVTEPDLDLKSIEIVEGKPIELNFEVETKPEFELGDYKSLEIEMEPVKVTDEDVDEAINAIRSRFASLTTVEDKPISEKHYLTIDVTYQVEGEEEVNREGCQANMGHGIVDGIELGDEKKKFFDKKLNDIVELDIAELPEHFLPEALRGKPASMKATIKEIREVTIPEVDDEFLKKVQIESVEKLREQVGEEVMKNKEQKRSEEIDQKLMEALIEKHDFEIPEKLLMKQISTQEDNLRYELMRAGMPADKVAEQTGKLDDTNRKAAERNIRSNFLYDKIAKKESIYVTENELEAELQVVAQQQNATLQEIKSYYEEHDLMGSMRSLLRNQKIRKMLRDSAKIVEKSDGETSETTEEASKDESGESEAKQ